MRINFAVNNLTIKLMNKKEVYTHYLPLRYEIYDVEFNYVKKKMQGAWEFLDQYDNHCVPFGIFSQGNELIAAARVVTSSTLAGLPSGNFLGGIVDCAGDGGLLGEISRVLVRNKYRKVGLFRAIIATAILVAKQKQVEFLFISGKEHPKHESTLNNFGFSKIVSSYYYIDDKIAPPVESATFKLDANQTLTKERLEALTAWRNDQLLRSSQLIRSSAKNGSSFGCP